MRIAIVKIDYLNKTFPYDAGDFEAKPGDTLIIETEFGIDFGTLMEEIDERKDFDKKSDIQKVVRLANAEDIAQIRALTEKEENAFEICHGEINGAQLAMKLVSARYSFDSSKISFCYTAENRVDFRQLVKTLATRLRARIELRQVGVRDEARLFGGIGPCGRPLCCATFLDTFAPVSIRMAKEQGLPLNPLKISGICGRLFCCLKYEFDYYQEARKKMPRAGDTVEHEGKRLRVLYINVLKTMITGEDEEGARHEVVIPVKFEHQQILKPGCGKGCGKDHSCCGAPEKDEAADGGSQAEQAAEPGDGSPAKVEVPDTDPVA